MSHVMNALRRIFLSSFTTRDDEGGAREPSRRREVRAGDRQKKTRVDGARRRDENPRSSRAPLPRSFFSSMPGASSRKSAMSALAAVATGLSLARLYCARSWSKSSCITSGHRRQISRTVLIPTATTSGRARSCTNWLTSWRRSGSSASGGTSSWHAVAAAARRRVTSAWLGCTYRCRNGYRWSRCNRVQTDDARAAPE